MGQVPGSWCTALFLMAGSLLFIGCDLSPGSGDRINGPSFLLTTTSGIGAWTAKAPMPTARYSLGAATINGILYAVGGTNDATDFATLEAYDPATNTWTTKTPMPTARQYVGVAALNGILYAVGGNNVTDGYLATVEAYDPATDTWTTKKPMPSARSALGVASINGILYAIGGIGPTGIPDGGTMTTVEAYNPTTDTWTTKASLPSPRSNLAVTVVDGVLYAIGGELGCCTNFLATVEAYDPTTDMWTLKASMSTARAEPGAAVLNGIVYVLGGYILATVEAYDPASDTWATKPSMSTARYGPGVAAFNGILYAVGGYDGSMLATVEAFTPPYAFTGFFRPVDNPPMVNTLKAGSAVPVKFSLHGYQGLDIFAPGFPSSQGYTCDGSAEDAIEQTVTAGSSSLSYDATADQYTYVWKTNRAWVGTCRQLQLGLKEGSVQVALFHFTK